MKFYARFPANALEGMSELTLEQVGAYNLLIDLLYARDGIVPDDDVAVAHMIYRDPRTWRVMKKQLMAAGKVRVTNEGLLTANGVEAGLSRANLRSEISRRAATQRWDRFRLAKKIKDRPMQTQCDGNATKTKSKNSEYSLPLEHAKPLAVDNGENSNGEAVPATTRSTGTGELKAALRAKGWI